MTRQWRIHRQFRTATDGARRWDQAYQLLLEWGQPVPGKSVRPLVTRASPAPEEEHEHGDLCTGVDRAAGPRPDH